MCTGTIVAGCNANTSKSFKNLSLANLAAKKGKYGKIHSMDKIL